MIKMNIKYIVGGVVAFSFILGWNVFLIQRDEKLYDAHYRQGAVNSLNKQPANVVK